jgi:hypothetical protein
MKRSEMITIIRSCFGAYEDSQRQAEYILEVIEHEGMLPPIRKNDYILEYTDWDNECNIPEYAFKCDNCNCEEEE